MSLVGGSYCPNCLKSSAPTLRLLNINVARHWLSWPKPNFGWAATGCALVESDPSGGSFGWVVLVKGYCNRSTWSAKFTLAEDEESGVSTAAASILERV